MIYDTIAAIATAPGEGSIGIIRVSGADAVQIVAELFKKSNGICLTQVSNYTINYGHFTDGLGNTIDECLVSVMRGKKTFTGEDVVEVNCHGGFLPMQRVLEAIIRMGVRPAEPGEFTKRAFLNGRIDLIQAESIIDIIRAKTDEGLNVAIDQLKGKLSQQINNMRSELLGLLAVFEANIDFPEEDVPPVEYSKVSTEIQLLADKTASLIDSWHSGKIIRDGLKTAIIGKPNVGKSSLLNVLLREERAIVTDIPGTTRDTIEEVINLDGIPLRIIDTAGIRDSDDLVEQMGIAKSMELLDQADLILLVVDATDQIGAADTKMFELVKDKQVLVLLNKTDLVVKEDTVMQVNSCFNKDSIISISAKEELGIEELTKSIKNLIFKGNISVNNQLTLTNSRHYIALVKANDHLNNLLDGLKEELPVDFLTIDLTSAYHYLGEILGETIGEDILDRIFSEFCIGK